MTSPAKPESTTLSDRVREFYERFPYPPKEPGMSVDPYLDYILSFRAKPPSSRPTFLDAGCGTGSNLLGAAVLHRGLDIFGCDFNEDALEFVQNEVEFIGASNVELRRVDLLNIPQGFGPEGGFDIIFCTGVIHHTSDPLGVLKSLADRLAPQGILRLMVYARPGREPLYRFADTVSRMADSESSWDVRYQLAKSLMDELHEAGENQGVAPPALRGLFEGSHQLSPEEFADRYLNPQDKPYDLSTLQNHIEAAGLKFLRWFEERSWDLDELLPEQARAGEFPTDPWQRFRLVEELYDRDQYDLFLVKPGFEPRRTTLDWDTPLRINPQTKFTETTFRGIGSEQSIRLLFEPSEDLTVQQGFLLRNLSRRTLSLSELLLEFRMEATSEWFEAARHLWERQYLYSPVFP